MVSTEPTWKRVLLQVLGFNISSRGQCEIMGCWAHVYHYSERSSCSSTFLGMPDPERQAVGVLAMEQA